MKKVTCISCNEEIENWEFEEHHVQPLSGVAFRTYGHYGSEVFDPMDGTYLEIVVCDSCLLQHKDIVYGNGKL